MILILQELKLLIELANMLQKANCQVKVAIMPDGMDPDDYVKNYGEEKFRNDVIGSSLTFMGFKMLYLSKREKFAR